MNLHSFGCIDEVVINSGIKLIEVITEQIKSKKRVLVLLSGGSVVQIYSELGRFIKESEILLKDHLFFAQVDERFRPGDQVVSRKYKVTSKKNNSINAEAINESGLWRICESNKIPYYLISQKGTLNEAVNEYNQTLERLFKECDYKIAVLGIGEDGHTAGLLPGYQKKWDLPKFVAGYKNKGKFIQRMSLTPQALRKINYALMFAAGEKKRNAIENLLKRDTNSDLNKYPAAVIRNIKDVNLYTNLNL